MRDRNLLWPFPSAPCRNYNVLGAGYNEETGTWDHRWPGMEASALPNGFQELVQQFQNFVENKKDHREFTELGWGVAP